MKSRENKKEFILSRGQKSFIFLLLILLILAALIVVVSRSLKTNTIQKQVDSDSVLRTLFVVEDENKKDLVTHKALFSTVLVYYPVSKKALLINVPGNVGGIYNSLGRVDRIDDVYKEKGIIAFKKEVEVLLGMKIPFTVTIRLQNFVQMVDYLGGLRLFIPAPIDTDSEEGERYLLPSGAVTLDGDKIYIYLKYRMEEEEESTIQERYQNVAGSFFTSIHEKRSTYFNNKKTFRKFSSLFRINLDKYSDIFNLFSYISDMDSENITRQTVTGRLRVVDNEKLLFPLNNGDFIKEAVKQSTNMLISNSGTSASRVYVLEIKNGTTVQGLAHNTAILFQNASYDVLSSTNADRMDYEKTQIIDHIGNKEMAAMVGDFIHCKNIIEEEIDYNAIDNTAGDVDFTIILGKDFDGRYVR